LPKPVDVPVMKKTRGMMADVPNDHVKWFLKETACSIYIV